MRRKCSSDLSMEIIHETNRVVHVGADLAVHLNQALHEDLLHLLVGERVLQAVAQDKHQRKALTKLVRASGRTRSPGAAHLVKHPVLGRREALHMPLWSACHGRRSGSLAVAPM